jgi:ADP-heptose:LPS heptosyltransferase
MLNSQASHRFLVVRPDAIGDVCLMIPMLNSLKKTFPNAKIYTLQQPYTEAILNDHPSVSKVLTFKKNTSFFQKVEMIKSYQFSAVIFSYFELDYAVLMWAARIPIRIGDKNKLGLRFWLTHPVKQNFRNLMRHETEHNTDLLSPLCTPISVSTDMDVMVKDSAKEEAKSILLNHGWDRSSPLICIHPTTGGGNRAWLPQKYAEMIQEIIKRQLGMIVLTGSGEKDTAFVQQIMDQCKSKSLVSLVGKTSVDCLKGLLSLSNVVIGTDTGPTHIAAGLKRPVVIISPTKFVKSLRWGPWGTVNEIIGNPGSCPFVCNPYKCRHTNCLDAIEIRDVCNAIQKLLHFPVMCENNKKNWFKSSTNLVCLITSPNSIKNAKNWLDLAKREGINVSCITQSKVIYGSLLNQRSYSVKKVSLLNIFSIVSFLAKKDITMIHVFGSRKYMVWLSFIRQCVAPFIYCPPIIIHESHIQGLKPISLYAKLFSNE